MSDHAPEPAALLDLSALAAQRAEWEAAALRVVLTNGCFDLLHVGHARYLAQARALGDLLVVALNDDASTRALKGPGRPVLPLAERAELLAALRSVDAVVAFAQPTAVEVVRALRPDVYAKGADYATPGRRPPEAEVAEALGAQVVYLPFHADQSTSALLARIRKSSP
jgi:rfaE bifunctional protein nucleotidyltransferase chain/domain